MCVSGCLVVCVCVCVCLSVFVIERNVHTDKISLTCARTRMHTRTSSKTMCAHHLCFCLLGTAAEGNDATLKEGGEAGSQGQAPRNHPRGECQRELEGDCAVTSNCHLHAHALSMPFPPSTFPFFSDLRDAQLQQLPVL